MNTKTGLGWDEETYSFTTSEEHWVSLEEVSNCNFQQLTFHTFFSVSKFGIALFSPLQKCVNESLNQRNKLYADFKQPYSYYIYHKLSSILFGNHATGSCAQLLARLCPLTSHIIQEPLLLETERERLWRQHPMVGTPRDSVLEADEEDVYYVPPIPKAVRGKRLATSLRTSGEQEGTRGSKSTWDLG